MPRWTFKVGYSVQKAKTYQGKSRHCEFLAPTSGVPGVLPFLFSISLCFSLLH
jgi:hypothetical protein